MQEEKLNYLEKLQLISLTDYSLFTIQNKLYCILKLLKENEKLIFLNNTFKIKPYLEDELCNPYEEKFVQLYNQMRYDDLFDFLNNLKLVKTFEIKGIIKVHFKKTKFNLFNKHEIEKTTKFYDIYNKYVDESESKDLFCYIMNKCKDDDKIIQLSSKIISKFNLN